MSGDYSEVISLLEDVIENQETIMPILTVISDGIGYLIAFIVMIILIILLKYAYKFLDIFF